MSDNELGDFVIWEDFFIDRVLFGRVVCGGGFNMWDIVGCYYRDVVVWVV